MRNFLCIGHRGARGYEPENTLCSISRALDLGVHGVEVDVHVADGQLVVIHDETLERTTNGTGAVCEKTFDCLRSLDAGHGEKIPTLREVFDTVNRRAFVNVEMKGRGTAEPVRALVSEYAGARGWTCADFLISSFDLSELRKLVGFEIRLAPLFSELADDCADVALALGAYSVHVPSTAVDEVFVKNAHAAGLKVFVYTVNGHREIRAMRKIGVDGLFTDYPDRLLSLAGSG